MEMTTNQSLKPNGQTPATYGHLPTERTQLPPPPEPPPTRPYASASKPTAPAPSSLDQAQRKYPKFRGLMQPHPSIQHHPAFPLLFQYATQGCPVDCGPQWTSEQLNATVRQGAHPSARSPEAQACLREETLEKVQQGFARLVLWDDIKEHPPPNLKISPVAAVPHKSRRFRTILDLSFQLRVAGLRLPSVNAATRKQALTTAMRQLGKVLPRLIAAMAAAALQHGPIFFAKWDIKDGFW